MKIFLTGGSGFIGSRLAPLAVNAGHEVTVVTPINTPTEKARCEALTQAGIKLVIAPLEDSAVIARELQGKDAVIHLAAAQHEAEQPESYFHRINVDGTRSLLEAAAKAGVRRFVHGSTIGVYGSAADGSLDEDSPLAPDNPYGRTKMAAEKVVREFVSPLEWTIIRISETYGPGDMRLLKLFKGVKKGRFPIIGGGRNLHQVIYVEDLSRGLLAACTQAAANKQTVVLAGSEKITTNDMVAAVSDAVGNPKKPPHVPLWPFMLAARVFEATFSPLGLKPPLHRRRLDFFKKSFYFSNARAENVLNFRPQVPFREGARKSAEWYQTNGLI
ncbi:MAG: NAD-dependent epimerase/dehydratase family protein [Proteobacteria bacterium]|nr:NAD-dependent epimerase/dehydratase family protein [Pseudomonadota bacterium]